MSSIGPELPPHLQVQKTHDSDLEETTNSTGIVGPQIPAHLLSAPNDNGDSDEDDYVPELPPDMVAGPSIPTPPPNAPAKAVVGPSFPPSGGEYGGDGDDDDDDDFGPQPLPAGYQHRETSAVQRFIETEEKRRKEVEEAAKPKTLKRDEWMLVPPSTSDILGSTTRPDKTQSTTVFAVQRSCARCHRQLAWTETPAERQQRLADEVSGKKRRAVDPKVDEEDDGRRKKRRDEEDIRKGVEDYTRKIRGPALLSQHASTLSANTSTSNEAPPAIWDHSRDMSLGGRLMDDDKRNKLVREAKGLGDRFGTGKSGGFL
ncbi:hypothetical protein BD779DRAFT_1550529 [Infundibulicybe gibba]|nr:hypothetical protein BD779DRAFT_1550529 [Infundibulicybe gibba]